MEKLDNQSPAAYIIKIKEYQKEIGNLKKKIQDLENKNKIYQIQIIDFQKEKINVEQDLKNLQNSHQKDKKQIINLEKEVENIDRTEKEKNRLLEISLQNEVNFYKGLHETGLAKVDAADNIIKLNNAQNKYIEDLEDELQKLRSNSDVTICRLKIQHDKHYYDLKQKMMGYIKEAQHNMAKNNADNLELSSKLAILYKNQMLNELENQSIEIQNLIKIKEKQDKLIYALKNEIEVHKSVEKSVLSKNANYINIIKKLEKIINEDKNNKNESNKIDDDNNIENNDKNENEKHERQNTDSNLYFRNMKNFEQIDELKEGNIPILNGDEFNKFYSQIVGDINLKRENYDTKLQNLYNKHNMKLFNDYLNLLKIYKNTSKNYQNLKNKFKTMKDKEKSIQQKFSGILKLYEFALEELLKNDDLKQKKIYLNEKNISSGNFDSFNSKQKYIIITKLVQQLLPLIDDNNEEKEIFILKNSFQNDKINTTRCTMFSHDSSSRVLSMLKINDSNYKSGSDEINSNKTRNVNINLEDSNSIKSSVSNFHKTMNSIYKNNKLKNLELKRHNIFSIDNKKNLYKINNNKPLMKLMKIRNFNSDLDAKNRDNLCLTRNQYFN